MRTACSVPLRRRALTLIEVTIALGVTAMIGVAVSAMLVTVSEGTMIQDDNRRIGVKKAVIASRLDASIRSSRMILAKPDDGLVLWTGDSTANGSPNISEIVRIQWSRATNEVWVYAASPKLKGKKDLTYGLASDFASITAGLIGRQLPGQRWGTEVTGFTVRLDETEPQRAALVNYRLTLEASGLEHTMTRQAALRSR